MRRLIFSLICSSREGGRGPGHVLQQISARDRAGRTAGLVRFVRHDLLPTCGFEWAARDFLLAAAIVHPTQARRKGGLARPGRASAPISYGARVNRFTASVQAGWQLGR